ncbi:MAG: hypothetical protein ABW107_16745 [Candidatus Thiodiazotropha sp. 6PLUC5]
MLKIYLDLYHHRQSVFLMVRRDTLLRIKGTLLGPIWLLAQSVAWMKCNGIRGEQRTNHPGFRFAPSRLPC